MPMPLLAPQPGLERSNMTKMLWSWEVSEKRCCCFLS
jgi:hypothetical protein